VFVTLAGHFCGATHDKFVILYNGFTGKHQVVTRRFTRDQQHPTETKIPYAAGNELFAVPTQTPVEIELVTLVVTSLDPRREVGAFLDAG
jgi:hypothetical protein